LGRNINFPGVLEKTGDGRRETVFRRRETGDYFYLFFPRNAHAVTPLHPTPYTLHPIPKTGLLYHKKDRGNLKKIEKVFPLDYFFP
jgi:hypothetical protein